MPNHSITATLSFQTRLLRSERWRTGILAGLWAVAIIVNTTRRAMGGRVMSVDQIYFTSLSLLLVAIAFQAVMFFDAQRRLKAGRPMTAARQWLTAVVDLALPTIGLASLVVHTPAGATPAIAAPVLLAYPAVIALSILRLAPMFSLATGLLAAPCHAGVVIFAISRGNIPSEEWPSLFSYAIYLAVQGGIAAFIASQARGVVREAIDEATAAERSQRSLQEVERDLNIARDIQRGLMPTGAPVLRGYDIAGMARPAQQTGGDYYDWQPLPDGRLVVAVADVTGHGIGPALVMAVCRAYARAYAPGAGNASAILTHINGLIHDDLGASGRFITMVTALLSPDGRVDLVSAGHGPTFLYRAAEGTIEWFGGDGLPLGIMPDSDYPASVERRMEHGDILLLVTDGFMEWTRTRDGQQFGIQRLADTLKAAATLPAEQIIKNLDAALLAFAENSPQGDDTTAVVIKKI
jgi:serine phosphatase RsbU (regulator of sigma subunit)